MIPQQPNAWRIEREFQDDPEATQRLQRALKVLTTASPEQGHPSQSGEGARKPKD